VIWGEEESMGKTLIKIVMWGMVYGIVLPTLLIMADNNSSTSQAKKYTWDKDRKWDTGLK